MEWSILIALILGIGNAFVSIVLLRQFAQVRMVHKKSMAEMNINAKLTEAFAKGGSESIYSLARHLYHHTKKRYNLQAQNHAELIKELRAHGGIDNNVRESLIDFFENLMLVSYKKENVSEEEKEVLKKKIKTIILHLQTKK